MADDERFKPWDVRAGLAKIEQTEDLGVVRTINGQRVEEGDYRDYVDTLKANLLAEIVKKLDGRTPGR